MKKIILIVFLASFLSGTVVARSEGPGGPDSSERIKARLASNIKAMLQRSCLKDGEVGLHIVSLSRGDTLFTWNGSKQFIPASNVKIITSSAALKLLDTDYRFVTTLRTDAKRRGPTLDGNLYLKGSGDPFFVSEEMWRMVKDLRNLGVRSINGDLVVDDSFFDTQRTGNGWGKRLGPEAYNAKIAATSLNFNTITVYVAPADKIGARPVVTIDPDTDYVRVDNRAVTVKSGKRHKLIINRIPGKGFDTVAVTGKISSRARRRKFFLNVSDPLLFTATVFREFLDEMGITVLGNIRFGITPKTAALLLEHESKPMQFIVRGLNKYSNNFMAEQILKTLGAVREGPPGTFQKGLRQVRNYLESIGILRGTYVLEDGSGLSRLNRLTARQIVEVLEAAYSDFKIRPEFLSSLSIMGVDGSVKDRLARDTELHYRTRVKTGTLAGVSALSGFLEAEDKEVIAFSILTNYKRSGRCSMRRVHGFQDRVVKDLSRLYR